MFSKLQAQSNQIKFWSVSFSEHFKPTNTNLP